MHVLEDAVVFALHDVFWWGLISDGVSTLTLKIPLLIPSGGCRI